MILPIRQLTLYKHGISVVERGGAVSGESAALTFHRDQMNDVLKSLVAFDRGGGQIRTIAYDAPEEREDKLARGSIHLSDESALLDLLRDLRGRAIHLHTTPEAGDAGVMGTVVGLDVPENHPFKRGRLSLLTEEGIRVIRLEDIHMVQPLDTQAKSDLAFFLRASIAEPDQRTVTLRLSEGEHDLVVRYLAPSPTWRVSYRLVGEQAEDGTRRALLQGWGIFDNPFDEALENVMVKLVAGMPISFVYDLYTPFTPDRPVVREEARVTTAPIEMERAKMMRPPPAPITSAPAGMARGMAMATEGYLREEAEVMAADEAYFSIQESVASSTTVAAQGEAQGDLFEYRIGHPVTVQRGEAAMVPILSTLIPYRKEHIYNGQKHPRHPVVVLRFDNESDLTLERGPITVMENNNYIGEAIFPFTRPKSEVLLAVAVDLGVSVREETENTRETHHITIQNQYLLFHEYSTRRTRYEVSNSNVEAISLQIEYPRIQGYDLLEMPAPSETTEQHYRWTVEVPAGPGGEAKFEVRERRLEQRYEYISNLSYDNLSYYLRQRWLDEALGGGLRELLDLYAERQRIQQRLNEIESERSRFMATQEQARKNMSGLKDTGDEGALRARYVRQLNESEDALAALEAERTKLRTDDATLEQRIQAKIAALA